MDPELAAAPAAADPSRRALLAGLAGGLALAAPKPAKGQKKDKAAKKKPKPKPTLATAVAVVTFGGLQDDGVYRFFVRIHAQDLRPGAGAGGFFDSTFSPAAALADRLQAAIVAHVRESTEFNLDVPADRVSVLLVFESAV